MTFYRKGDEIVATFRPEEIDVLRMVVTQVSELVTEGLRADPVFERLFPDIYQDNPVAAAELRRYTEDDLKQAKVDAAAVVLDTLDEHTTLTVEQADAWLRAVNDVRLALGTRLEIGDDFDIEEEYEDADDERGLQISVYGYLSYLQESLIDSLT
ncbi:hypothetical protein Lfu02_14020 [Longispora fulva]|uniref:DUF2017 domain-containing protein n=1 Tax=Longispora fulva TaxID=619741 RepID=A0A8J7GP09_9ACTN|nr:DUF2017 domain-containing protein [Longispora fulva]MBG6140588.1 hypothetical protein [Longispora fulva]GIG57030.1 hypothetical protein Lfu02_14020 [Longispora fulva]